jgi:hypothetical protein
MSGSFIFTGKETNNGDKNLILNDLLSKKINNLIIHSIPLSNSVFASYMRYIGKKYYQLWLHPALTPTLSHIAIQLNLENNDIVIIEYGQYLTKDSDIKNGFFSSGSKSSNTPRKDSNDNLYYYINKDGARITKISKEKYSNKNNNESINDIIQKIIAAEQYHIPYEEFDFNFLKKGIVNGFHKIECNVNNKITLGELIENFKEEKWEAKNYNVLSHNCQTFGAEVIKLLKAVRVNDYDKIRIREKMILPNCMIKVLWDNEDLSVVNTLGRIPVFGLAFDLISGIVTKKK